MKTVITSRIPIIFFVCLASLALTACVDENDGECNVRDYSDVRRVDMPADYASDSDLGSEGRDE